MSLENLVVFQLLKRGDFLKSSRMLELSKMRLFPCFCEVISRMSSIQNQGFFLDEKADNLI